MTTNNPLGVLITGAETALQQVNATVQKLQNSGLSSAEDLANLANSELTNAENSGVAALEAALHASQAALTFGVKTAKGAVSVGK